MQAAAAHWITATLIARLPYRVKPNCGLSCATKLNSPQCLETSALREHGSRRALHRISEGQPAGNYSFRSDNLVPHRCSDDARRPLCCEVGVVLFLLNIELLNQKGASNNGRFRPFVCHKVDMLIEQSGKPLQENSAVPRLSEDQIRDAENRTSVSAAVVHEAIRKDGDEELQRPTSALAWSGLAAGMSMGFSFLAEGLFRTFVPDVPWRPLLVNLGYPLGFLIVIIGRQQLFTENTLTAIIPLLARRNFSTLMSVMRLWAVVLISNVLGALLFAWCMARTSVVHPETQTALTALARSAADVTFGTAVLRGIFAGWLIAMVVWMRAAVNTGQIAIIIILTYIVGLAGLTHIIAGSVEVLYLVASGELSWWSCMSGYMTPTLLGNIIGGTALVSALNHAQVVSGHNIPAMGIKSIET